MIQKLSKLFFTFIFCLTISILLIGCQNSSESSTLTNVTSTIDVTKTNLVDAYLEAIDLIYHTSPELNEPIKYLAIDTSVLLHLDEESRTNLLTGLSDYGVNVLDSSFEDLNTQGYLKDGYFEEGLFLKLEDSPITNNQITLVPSKWRSTTYAAGLSKVILTLQDEDTWVITDSGIPWRQ